MIALHRTIERSCAYRLRLPIQQRESGWHLSKHSFHYPEARTSIGSLPALIAHNMSAT